MPNIEPRIKKVLNLSEPLVLEALFESFLEEILDGLQGADSPEDSMDDVVSIVGYLSSMFSGKDPDVICNPDDCGARLGQRLYGVLCKLNSENKELLNLAISPSEFIPIALMTMAKQFIELVSDCSSEGASQEVFDLRCSSFVSTWVKYFLGEKR